MARKSEASALTRLYNAIERQGGEELSDTKKQIIEYIRFVVEEPRILRILSPAPTFITAMLIWHSMLHGNWISGANFAAALKPAWEIWMLQ